MNARKLFIAGLGCAAAGSAFAAPGGQILYSYKGAVITVLGTLEGDNSSTAYDINNAGQIVGSSASAPGVYRGFSYKNSFMQQVPAGIGFTSWEAKGVNNLGEVVGTFRSGGFVTRPFYWKSGVPLQPIKEIEGNPYSGPYPNYVWSTSANAINDNGVIVGDSRVQWETVTESFPDLEGDCYSHIPVRWTAWDKNPQMIFCPAAGANPIATAFDVNNGEYVAGMDRSSTAYGLFTIHIGASFETSVPFPTNPSSNNPGSRIGEAFGINDKGAIVGYMSYGGVKRALYWSGNTSGSRDLGVLPNGTHSLAREVNEQGFVTGYSEYKTSPQAQTMNKAAFIYHANFGMKQLPAPTPNSSIDYCEAFALNDRVESTGTIQAVGRCLVNGNWRAVLWNIDTSKYMVIN